MAAYGRFFTDSAAKQRVVKEVQFGVLSPDEIVGIHSWVKGGLRGARGWRMAEGGSRGSKGIIMMRMQRREQGNASWNVKTGMLNSYFSLYSGPCLC